MRSFTIALVKLAVVDVALARSEARTRMPFRFGAVTVRDAHFVTCRVRVRTADGQEGEGWSGDLMVPRWFRKDTDATPEQDTEELHAAVVEAARCYVAAERDTAFGLWRAVFRERVDSQPEDQPDLLVRGFGVALVERATIDAVCRLLRMPFAAALKSDRFGFLPERVHQSLAGWDWRDDLPQPKPHVVVRHTVGMLDVLRARDVPAEARVADGLPQALEQDIDAYGLSWFKIKIGAGVERDRERLLDLAAFFEQRGEQPGFSLDGNEQYEDMAQLAELLEAVSADSRGRAFLDGLAWIEQPLARTHTFDTERHSDVARVRRFAPLILDEADATPRSFTRALELGYRGVSVKNCKGVFRALCNFGVCRSGEGRFQTAEDLTNVGVLALQQDLVTGSVLGLPHVERNGHHYFRGLDHLGPDLARRALAAHPDIYRELPRADGVEGGVGLRIEGGRIAIASALQASGYGTSMSQLVAEPESELVVVARA